MTEAEIMSIVTRLRRTLYPEPGELYSGFCAHPLNFEAAEVIEKLWSEIEVRRRGLSRREQRT